MGRRIGAGALWLVTVLEAVMMALAGWSKFANPDGWTSMFEGWGYPTWFAFVVGGCEVLLALVLLLPRWASYAALGLIAIMLGALGTVALHPGGRMGTAPPIMNIALLGIILSARWKSRWRRH